LAKGDPSGCSAKNGGNPIPIWDDDEGRMRWSEEAEDERAFESEEPNPGENETRFETDFERPWFISLGRTVCIDVRSVGVGEDVPESKSTTDVDGVMVGINEGDAVRATLGSSCFEAEFLPPAAVSKVSLATLSETAAFPEAISAILPSDNRLMSGLAFRAIEVDSQCQRAN
jgi:hypothetical protein